MARDKSCCGCGEGFEGLAPFEADDEFGYLYQTRPYGLVPNMDSTDERLMEPRSGSTGFRGTKPAFGAEGYNDDSVEVGVGAEGLWFTGDHLTAIVLAGLGVAAVALSR